MADGFTPTLIKRQTLYSLSLKECFLTRVSLNPLHTPFTPLSSKVQSSCVMRHGDFSQSMVLSLRRDFIFTTTGRPDRRASFQARSSSPASPAGGDKQSQPDGTTSPQPPGAPPGAGDPASPTDWACGPDLDFTQRRKP